MVPVDIPVGSLVRGDIHVVIVEIVNQTASSPYIPLPLVVSTTVYNCIVTECHLIKMLLLGNTRSLPFLQYLHVHSLFRKLRILD